MNWKIVEIIFFGAGTTILWLDIIFGDKQYVGFKVFIAIISSALFLGLVL